MKIRVSRRGNAVGRDARGNIVTVEPRGRVRVGGQPTPWAVRTYLDTAACVPIDSDTYATKEDAVRAAEGMDLRPLGW